MATQPLSPTSKKGVRRFLREKYDSIKSHLRSPSQQFLEVSSSRAYSKSPTPSERLNPTIGVGGASLSPGPAGVSLRRTGSLPTLVVDSLGLGAPIVARHGAATEFAAAGSEAKPLGARVGNISTPGPAASSGQIGTPAWTGLGSALRVLHETTRHFPPLQSAIGALISCIDTWEVSFLGLEVCIHLL